MATEYSAHGRHPAPDQSVPAQALFRVLRASGVLWADAVGEQDREGAVVRRKGVLVDPDETETGEPRQGQELAQESLHVLQTV